MKNFIFLYPVLILIHLPLSLFTGIDESCILLYLLDFIFFINLCYSNKLFKIIVKSKISQLWFILIVYHAINSFIHHVPYQEGYIMMFMRMFDTYFLMLLCAYCFISDKNRYLKYMSYGFSVFLFITLFITTTGTGQRLVGSINATQIGQTAGCAMLIIVLSKYINNMGILKFILFSILPIIVTLLAGSRNGLLLISIALIAFVFANNISKLQIKNVFFIIIGCIALYFIADYVFNNTMVGARMLSTSEQAEAYGLETGTILDKFGDRGVFYFYGWGLFLKQPIFGIGLWNFRYVSPIPFPLHTEYMVHLCEGGLIAAILYFLIIKKMIKVSFSEFGRNKNAETFILLLFMLSYLFVGLSARLLFTPHFYTLLGPILSLYIIKKYKYRYLNHY